MGVDDDAAKAVRIEWKYHPLREFLRLELINELLELDNDVVGPVDVWNKYCDVRPDLFEGMSCDQLFAARLRGLRFQTQQALNRADEDEDAFFIHRQNYPYQPYDTLGRRNWYGSEAEQLLEQDIAAGRYPTLKPEELRTTRQEYMEFSLDAFRGHIHQILETKKYKHTLKTRDAEKKAARETIRKEKIEAATRKKEAAAKKREAAAKKKEVAAKKKEAAAQKKEAAAQKKVAAAEKKAAAAEEAAKKKAEKMEATAKKKEAAAKKKEEVAKKKEAAAEKKAAAAKKREEAAKKKAEKMEAAAKKKEEAAKKKEEAAKKVVAE
jgi:hypothetical protein